jgi:hypothetical protein
MICCYFLETEKVVYMLSLDSRGQDEPAPTLVPSPSSVRPLRDENHPLGNVKLELRDPDLV